jgi:hypothetical protein
VSHEPEIHDHDDPWTEQRDCRTCRTLVLEKRVRELEDMVTLVCNSLDGLGLTAGLRGEAARMRENAEARWSEPAR